MMSVIEAATPYVAWLALLLGVANFITGWLKERRERHVTIVRTIAEAENEISQMISLADHACEAAEIYPHLNDLHEKLNRVRMRLEELEVSLLPKAPRFWNSTHSKHVQIQRELVVLRGMRTDLESALAAMREA